MKSRLLSLIFSIVIVFSQINCTIPEIEDITPPVVTILYPYTGSVLSGSTIISVQATDNRDIAETWYSLDGVIMDRSGGAVHVFNLDLDEFADEQQHVIQASARDDKDNIGTSPQINIIISKTGDITAPTVQITNPQTGQEVAHSVNVVADAQDDRIVTEVAFFINGDSVYSDFLYPYEYHWGVDTLELFSQPSVLAKAFDAAGNFASSPIIAIRVVPAPDQIPPIARLVFPLLGQILYGTIVVQVDAYDESDLDRVEFYIDGFLKKSAHAPSDSALFTYIWDTSPLAEDSRHSIYFKAIDAAGNQSTNEAVSFTIGRFDQEPPILALLYPSEGDTLTGTVNVSVDVSDNVGVDRVEYYVDGGISGNPSYIASNPPWNYQWNTAPLAGRAHLLYIKAIDTSGNFSSVGPITLVIE